MHRMQLQKLSWTVKQLKFQIAKTFQIILKLVLQESFMIFEEIDTIHRGYVHWKTMDYAIFKCFVFCKW